MKATEAKKERSNIVIEKGQKREETLMVKEIYDKLEKYMGEHPESSFMVISCNTKDKVGTSFLLGSDEDIAKECTRLMLYKKDQVISRTFNRVFTHLFNFCRKFG